MVRAGIGSRQKNRSCLPPTWTNEELGKRSSTLRFFGRVFLFFRPQRPPYSGWSAIVQQVALTSTASLVVGLAACQAHRLDLIRSRHSRLSSSLGGFPVMKRIVSWSFSFSVGEAGLKWTQGFKQRRLLTNVLS